ncbi:hypothetical protein MKW98_030689 [Papaver atlanticum]|uniref:Uncharacterized protein n=1 Tax=Papaver atlanticum TaxID=357466 RepID=A0AAD4X3M5_9MAGN|nr:hypothetical protein MKW98_030689 [Papaver atlanticum]
MKVTCNEPTNVVSRSRTWLKVTWSSILGSPKRTESIYESLLVSCYSLAHLNTIMLRQLGGLSVKMITGDQLAIGKETGHRFGMGTEPTGVNLDFGDGIHRAQIVEVRQVLFVLFAWVPVSEYDAPIYYQHLGFTERVINKQHIRMLISSRLMVSNAESAAHKNVDDLKSGLERLKCDALFNIISSSSGEAKG